MLCYLVSNTSIVKRSVHSASTWCCLIFCRGKVSYRRRSPGHHFRHLSSEVPTTKKMLSSKLCYFMVCVQVINSAKGLRFYNHKKLHDSETTRSAMENQEKTHRRHIHVSWRSGGEVGRRTHRGAWLRHSCDGSRVECWRLSRWDERGIRERSSCQGSGVEC